MEEEEHGDTLNIPLSLESCPLTSKSQSLEVKDAHPAVSHGVLGHISSNPWVLRSIFSTGEPITAHGDLANHSSPSHFEPDPVLLPFDPFVTWKSLLPPMSTNRVDKSYLHLLLGTVFPLEGQCLSSPSFLSPNLSFLLVMETEWMQKRSGKCETQRDANQISSFMCVFAMALQSVLISSEHRHRSG